MTLISWQIYSLHYTYNIPVYCQIYIVSKMIERQEAISVDSESESENESLPAPLSEFFRSVKSSSSTEASCNNCKKKFKFSTKATSNLITHLKRCSPTLHQKYLILKKKQQEKRKKVVVSQSQPAINSYFPATSFQKFSSNSVTQRALTKALLNSLACDQLPLNIVESPTFRNLLLTAEPRFTIPSRTTIRNSHLPTATQQMEEAMRQKLAHLSNVYLTIDLWTNRNMTSFLGITVHFIDEEWKLNSFVLATDSFKGRHTAENIAEAYDNVIEKYRLTTKVSKVVSDNASSMIKAFRVSLPEFILHKTSEDSNATGEEQLIDLIPDLEEEMLEENADENDLFNYLPERVSCFAHTKQLCIKDCLQNPEFVKSYVGKQLGKVAKIVNTVRKSVNATSYLQRKKITLRAQNVTRWNSQLVMLQSVLKDHEEVNAALTLIQSREKITNQDYLALSELVNVLLPFKEAMQQVEGEKIVTSSCISPVVVGLLKSMEQLINSNLNYCRKLAHDLKESVSKRLLPFLKSVDNRLASLLDPRFKNKWIEDTDEIDETTRLLKTHVASRVENDEEKSSSAEDECEIPIKKPKIFGFMVEKAQKRGQKNSVNEVDTYLKEDIIPFNEDPLLYWKNNAEKFPTLANLAKQYLGLTATSAPAERVFSIAGNFYTAKRSLLGQNSFRSLVYIKCNQALYEQVKL